MYGKPREKTPLKLEDIPRIDPEKINVPLMRKVRTYLNKIGVGYPDPASEDESELMYFASLFDNDEQAEHYIAMKHDDWQTVESFCDETGENSETVLFDWETLVRRGVLYREPDPADPSVNRYRPLAFAHGLMEHGYMGYTGGATKHFRLPLIAAAQKSGRYARQYMMPDATFMRVAPVSPDIVKKGELLDADNPLKLLRQHGRFAVGKCVCRGSNPAPCSHTDECCIATDELADLYIEMKFGRECTYEELEQLLLDSVGNGSFVQMFSSKKAEVFCVCCGCPGGCAEIKFARAFPNGEAFPTYSNYYVYIEDIDSCIGCGTCESGCPMGNVIVKDGKTTIGNNACAGCSICANICPNGVLKMALKDNPYECEDDMWEMFKMEERTREGRVIGF